MYITVETRTKYRQKLILHYFNNVDIKTINTMNQIRRQVISMDDKTLIDNYDRLIDNK